MNDHLLSILEQVAAGTLSPADAQAHLAEGNCGIDNLGHTRLDLDRRRRRGVSEAVFCQGKTAAQIIEIAQRLQAAEQTVLCTRVPADIAATVSAEVQGLTYHAQARLLYQQNERGTPGHGTIAVLTAGTTDIPVAEEAALCAELWGNRVERIYDVGVAGLQRLLAVKDSVTQASVVIVAAGMEAALPSVVAGLVKAPVIAVPTSVGYGASLGGITALLGMINSCSGGIGTVNIDNGFGAALLAHMINHVGLETETRK